jgi:hypothetical protein
MAPDDNITAGISATATVSVGRTSGAMSGRVIVTAVVCAPVAIPVLVAYPPIRIVVKPDLKITFFRAINGTGRMLDAGMKESQSPPRMAA